MGKDESRFNMFKNKRYIILLLPERLGHRCTTKSIYFVTINNNQLAQWGELA
jgi:hypothetical protein